VSGNRTCENWKGRQGGGGSHAAGTAVPIMRSTCAGKGAAAIAAGRGDRFRSGRPPGARPRTNTLRWCAGGCAVNSAPRRRNRETLLSQRCRRWPPATRFLSCGGWRWCTGSLAAARQGPADRRSDGRTDRLEGRGSWLSTSWLYRAHRSGPVRAQVLANGRSDLCFGHASFLSAPYAHARAVCVDTTAAAAMPAAAGARLLPPSTEFEASHTG